MAVSKAHIRAVSKYEKANYFKLVVRFPKDAEELIRQNAGDSLNGYIVDLVLRDIGYVKDTPKKEEPPKEKFAYVRTLAQAKADPRVYSINRVVDSPDNIFYEINLNDGYAFDDGSHVMAATSVADICMIINKEIVTE